MKINPSVYLAWVKDKQHIKVDTGELLWTEGKAKLIRWKHMGITLYPIGLMPDGQLIAMSPDGARKNLMAYYRKEIKELESNLRSYKLMFDVVQAASTK